MEELKEEYLNLNMKDLMKDKHMSLNDEYKRVRQISRDITEPLSPEDQTVQSMPDCSPTKWHLAHVTWFFETFVLQPYLKEYQVYDKSYVYLFNSYYEAVGKRHPRPKRGMLTRPSLDEVQKYRDHVDNAMALLLKNIESSMNATAKEVKTLVILGLAHEQQHQELIFMDILNLFSSSILKPAYSITSSPKPVKASKPRVYQPFSGGIHEIGNRGHDVFAFDNEFPRHKVLLRPYSISSSVVTNKEWLQFMRDGGYSTAKYWLSDGWATVQANNWTAPLYWELDDEKDENGHDRWLIFTLEGLVSVDLEAPVSHISFYEAAAYALYAGKRLPTEAEWEHAMETSPELFDQIFDSVWQWTASSYAPHPGFTAADGAVGEYNAKFMSGQMVLRGGCCATPANHSRTSYRNFFYPHQRWMFSGLRLAEDILVTSYDLSFRVEVMAGLTAARKKLSPKWLYDEKGSDLFESICDIPEYYPTQQEIGLLRQIIPEISAMIQPGSVLIELGSGASIKTRILLDASSNIKFYKPIEISQSALDAAAQSIGRDYPLLQVIPVLGDFTNLGAYRDDSSNGIPKVGFFPGSTIGNFTPEEVISLLSGALDYLTNGLADRNTFFIVGVDLAKDKETLRAAYDDPQGVSADFNLNILRRINRELQGNVNLDNFEHHILINEFEGRVEMHLKALKTHEAFIGGKTINFYEGETIHTESSYKYTIDGFTYLAKRSGWKADKYWISSTPQFSIFLLSPQ